MCVCVSACMSFMCYTIQRRNTIYLFFSPIMLFHISNYVGFNLAQPDMMKWNTMHLPEISLFCGKKMKSYKKKLQAIQHIAWALARAQRKKDTHTHMFECLTTALYGLFTFKRGGKNKFKFLSTNRQCCCRVQMLLKFISHSVNQCTAFIRHWNSETHKVLKCLRKERDR